MAKSDTRKFIPFLVTIAHVLLLLGVMYIQPTPLKFSPRKPVAVHTVIIQEEVRLPVEPVVYPQPIPTPPPPPTLPPRPTPHAQPTPQAVPPQKRLSQARSPAQAAQHDKLISLVQESLNTLNSSKAIPAETKTTTAPIKALVSESLTFDAKYEEELIAYLETLLSLPERGEVKIKLTLKREGSVQNIEILKAMSTQNRDYIQTALTSCAFPQFGSHFKGETMHTFTVNLLSQ